MPGLVTTVSTKSYYDRRDEEGFHVWDNVRGQILSGQTLRGMVTPSGIAGPIVFLCSAAATHITGTVLNVDRGAKALEVVVEIEKGMERMEGI